MSLRCCVAIHVPTRAQCCDNGFWQSLSFRSDSSARQEATSVERATLSPDGFSARRFVEVLEQAAIWQDL